MKNRIFTKDWLLLKPYKLQSSTDAYYIKLSNNVKNTITQSEHFQVIKKYLNENDIIKLSCFLVSYFEDIISGTNIWNSFVRIHKRYYNKPIPFYNTEDYFENEINAQDISILIWYFINTIQNEKFILPYNFYIEEIADDIYYIFDEVWDYAPENTQLKTFYQINEDEEDYYIARQLMDTILFNSYLFYTDTLVIIKNKEREVIDENIDNDHLLMFLRENRDECLHKLHTKLLGLRANEWVAEIVSENTKLSNDFLNMSKRISGYFLYKGQNNTDVFLEHIASGKKFNLTKKSFDYSDNFKQIDTIIYIGIVRWRDEWWFSGTHYQIPYDSNLVLKEKKSYMSKMVVNFLDDESDIIKEMLSEQLKVFLDFTNGEQIVFLAPEKIEDYIQNYTDFFNASLNLSKKENEEAEKRIRKEVSFEDKNQHDDFSEYDEDGLVFYNHKSGLEIVFGSNSAFKMPKNSFFKQEDSEEHIMHLLMDTTISKELVMYCIEKGKNKLPFFKKEIGKLLLDDIDFLLRFWKREYYHTKPSITLVSEK